MIGKSLIGAALIALSAGAANAQPVSAKLVAASQPQGDVLWFTDAYANAWYWLDHEKHEVVIWIDPGKKGGNMVLTRRVVAEGAPEHLSISGVDSNRIRVTLVVTRSAEGLKANVVTEADCERQASN